MALFTQDRLKSINKKELEKIQLKRLKWSVRQALRSRLYKEKIRENLVIKRLEDIQQLPLTTKEDLLKSFPYGFLAEPLDRVVRIHMSSGTTGKPKVAAYTRNDVATWTNLMARGLMMVGVTAKDIFANTSTHNVFTGGLGILQAVERIGAAAIPLGPVGSSRTIQVMMDLGITAFHAIPSFAVRLTHAIEEQQVDPERDLRLRIAVCGAEPWSEAARSKIEEKLGVDAYDNYGLTELCGPGVAIECREKDGLHVWTDYFYPEIIDPGTGEVLEENEEGELVLTSLWKEAFPVLRFRTGDVCSITYEQCECGLVFPRISRIKGRNDDAIIIKGVNIWPSQIDNAVLSIHETTGNYTVDIVKKGYYKEITVKVEVKRSHWREREKVKAELEKKLLQNTFIRIPVNLVKEGAMPTVEGKARRIRERGSNETA